MTRDGCVWTQQEDVQLRMYCEEEAWESMGASLLASENGYQEATIVSVGRTDG
jgi:hypothetical protein